MGETMPCLLCAWGVQMPQASIALNERHREEGS